MQDTALMLHTLLELGESMLADGADVRRVEQTLTRMGLAYGAVRMDVFVITSSIVLTMCFPDETSVTQTRRIEKSAVTDFRKLEAINAISRSYCEKPFPVQELADRLHIPVVNTMMAKGIIPMDDKYSLWTIGIPQKDHVNQLFDRADVVIAIGYDIVECAPAKWGAREDMTIVHIDSAPADVNKRYQPAVEVVGNISESLYEILRCAHRTGEPEFALALRQTMVAEHEAMAADDSCPMKPARILADVRKVMGRDDILVSDVGAHKMWIARHYDCYEPNTCLISNGFASMGFSIPGAFAAKLLYPEKKVLALCGDGGFMMNSQELETAVRERVPFVTLIWEDSSYGLIKWKEQEQFGGEHCYVDFSNPDFKLLAEAMHCKGYRVEKADELIPTLEEAFRQDVPSVIVVPVDYSENMKLSEHLKQVCAQK